MHALGWSQEEAVQMMLQNTAMGEHDARTEVARYITWPGQACAYKVGERFIRKMRTYAETELKELFDPRDFYDIVLLAGAVPLDVLEERVKDYVDNTIQKSKPAGSTTVLESNNTIMEAMTFANWCKCCVVPGSCQTSRR